MTKLQSKLKLGRGSQFWWWSNLHIRRYQHESGNVEVIHAVGCNLIRERYVIDGGSENRTNVIEYCAKLIKNNQVNNLMLHLN